MKSINTQSTPKIEFREEKYYVGIGIVTPFQGMLGTADRLMKELTKWVISHQVDGQGPYLLRLNVIDMKGPMNLEVGFQTDSRVIGDDRVQAGVLPAGNYATLVYRGSALAGNRTLLEWIQAEGILADRDEIPEGDRFGCRYEAILTDPKLEPRKMLRDIQLSIRLKD